MKKAIFSICIFLFSLLFNVMNSFGQTEGFSGDFYFESIEINPMYEKYFSVEDWQNLTAASGKQNVRKAAEIVTSIEQLTASIKRSLMNYEDEISIQYNTNTSMNMEQLQDAYYAAMQHTKIPNEGDYIRSNIIGVEFNWERSAGSGYTYKYIINLQMIYTQTLAQEQEVTSRIEQVLLSLNLDGKTAAEKVRTIYDYVISHNSYDYSTNEGNYYPHSTHAALIAQKSVCQGYSSLFYRLLLSAGIDNRVATSKTHAWNIVQVGSKYYHTDTTWGDTTNAPDEFFLRSYDNIRSYDQTSQASESHVLDSDSAARLAGYPISDVDYSEESGDDEVMPTAIILSPSDQTIPVGSVFLLTVQFLPENTTDKDVILSFSDENVAAYISDIYPMDQGFGYWIIGTSAGSTVITVSSASDPSVKATCTVTVTGPKLVVSSVTARPGDEVEVGVSIVNNERIDSFSFDDPNYDETRLRYLGFEPSGFTFWDGNKWYGGSDDRTYNGEIMRLKFKVLDNAPEGDAVITLPNCHMICNLLSDLYAPVEIDFTPEIEPGEVTVVSPSLLEGGTLSVSDAAGRPGDEVEVSIFVSSLHLHTEWEYINQLSFDLEYDHTRLSCIGFEDLSLSGWEASPDFTGFIWDGETDDSLGGILKLKFKVLDNAPEGDAVVTLKNGRMYDSQGRGYYLDIDGGEVIIGVPSAEDGILSVSSAVANPGEEAEVGISLADNPGIISLSFSLDYDQTRLSFIGFEDSGFTRWKYSDDGKLEWWNYDDDDDGKYNGEILRLKFKVLDTAPEGDAFITLANCEMNYVILWKAVHVSPFTTYYFPEIVPGKVTVTTGRIPGDIDGDGAVTVADLIPLIRVMLQDPIDYDASLADLDGNGEVTMSDLIIMVHYILGDPM